MPQFIFVDDSICKQFIEFVARQRVPFSIDDHDGGIARHLDEIGVVAVGLVVLRVTAVVEDLAAQGHRALGDRLADPPQAQDGATPADHRAGQRHGRLQPLALAHVAVAQTDATGHREQ